MIVSIYVNSKQQSYTRSAQNQHESSRDFPHLAKNRQITDVLKTDNNNNHNNRFINAVTLIPMSASADFFEQHQPNKFDIIRGDSKDKYYKSRQLALIKNILPSISVVAQVNNDQCRLISDCLYYSLTTLLGRQTLGEECYYLVEYGPLRTIPTLIQRALMVALKIYVPYITRRVSSLKLLRY